MRSRRGLIAAFLVALSIQLAVLPVVEAVGPGPSPAPAPATELAAQSTDQPRQPQTKAAKQKQRQLQRQTQRRAKRQQQRKPGRPRNQQRPRRAAAQSGPGGQTSVPRLPGGALPGAEARAALAGDPGERYIVVYENESVDSQALTTALDQTPGVIPTHIYEHAIKGFAAYLTPAARQALAADPRVKSIIRDRQRFFAAQHEPRGTNRVDADVSPGARINRVDERVNADIAIIDSGSDLQHPDLNIFVYVDCASDPSSQFFGWDLNGHGTHVAGTAAALDNNLGVVGVAPGARIWSMRVMNDAGQMFDSYIIDCMDLVAFHAQTPFNGQLIDVANMSLGGPFPNDNCNGTDAFNDAVCAMVAAGVTTVVAAGNESDDAANHNPANLDEVITVSALADVNGQRGGPNIPFNAYCLNPQIDDGLATFSNYGNVVDIAAPGVDVLSTYPRYLPHDCTAEFGVGYDVFAGTSMSSPHVAGAAALLKAAIPRLSPDDVQFQLNALKETTPLRSDDLDTDDEGILNVAGIGGAPIPGPNANGPSVSITGPGAVKAKQRFTLGVKAADGSGIDRVVLYRCQPGCKVVAQDAAAPFRFVRRHPAPGRVRYKVRVYNLAGYFSEKFKTVQTKPAG